MTAPAGDGRLRIAAGQNPDEAGASYILGGSNPGAAGLGATKELASSAPGGALEEGVQHRGALDEEGPTAGPSIAAAPGPPPHAAAGPAAGAAGPGRKRPYSRSGQRRAYRIRFSDAEFAMIRRAAGWTRLRPMGFAATAAVAAAQDEEAARAGIVDARAAINELMYASAQFARAGNNLNQIAKAYNSGGEPTADIDAVLARLVSAVARMEQAAERFTGG
ncbi:MobC family plasmid mobilization relaxosome protein [Streptacidiphilus fuscans]|uniref:MobC family plasmid mobilization relaxosome protein n=1 Tax=Streptacidiphilus fuscans TaxID=2789292 RepID=A0A931B7Z8_9ACTN|nr:MobC family plasmid mobilization relaxosome protein [Streptacidiphilus fuscans]MBF9071816.1 MobC family plasmid mobilization relaxosome protein [Streptacidiphilus fuscans]